MVNKKIVTALSFMFSIAFLSTGCIKKEIKSTDNTPPQVTKVYSEKAVTKPKPVEKKYDLYSTTPYDLPLYSIVEISKLPQNIKETVDKILDLSQGFYLLRYDDTKVLIILQNPIINSETFSRHDLQFVEIFKDGTTKYHTAGYHGINGEISSKIVDTDNEWVFDDNSEVRKPLKHTSFDEKGKIKFIETWNYDDSEPIKYQMKDAHKKVLSILKESQDNDSNLRREHIFYDNDGKITMSLTVNYEGANISRLTFYNSHDSIDSMSILSEYTNGLKTKESIYNENYELINTVISDYIDGERKKIELFDKDGIGIRKISS